MRIAVKYRQHNEAMHHFTALIDGYDALGRVQSKQQTIGTQAKTLTYGYTNGQLTSLTTPSGQAISYGYSNGKLRSIQVNGSTLLNQVQYSPFGPTTGWTWGNGTLAVRLYNADGQLTTVDSAGLSTYTYNPDGTIASRTDDSSASLNLPTGLTNISVATTSNKLNTTTGTLNRTYAYDAAGNTQSDGSRSFTYNDAGRMTTASSAGQTTIYLYNPLGQRVQKSNASSTTNFVYDEAGHLIGEYDQSGALIQEVVWLSDIPVATIRTDQGGSGAGVFYIHTDHLNAPSKITRPTDSAVIWRWDHDPFGNGIPNQDPDGNGLLLTMNLRFPGQYADAETGLNYNYFRDYDPATGRYVESDPIGLYGEQFSTYAYVDDDPINFFDPFGLIRYNKPPPKTVPPTGDTLVALECLEKCLKDKTKNPCLDLLVTGAAEKAGHSKNSYHYKGQAVDIAGPKSNSITDPDVVQCAVKCGFGAGHFESFPNNPNRNHWHLQLTLGNGSPALPGAKK